MRGQRHGVVRTHTSRWITHKQEDIYNCRSFAQGVRALSPVSGFPACGSCIRKTSPRMPGFVGAALGSQRAVGNRDSAPRGYVLNGTWSGPGADRHWERAWVRPSCWSPRASQRGRKQRGLLQQHSCQNRELILPDRRYHFGVLPLSRQCWELTCPPASEPQPRNTAGPAASCPRVPRPTASRARAWFCPRSCGCSLCTRHGQAANQAGAQPCLSACHSIHTGGTPRSYIPAEARMLLDPISYLVHTAMIPRS